MMNNETVVTVNPVIVPKTFVEQRNEILNDHRLGERYLEYVRAHHFPTDLQPPVTIADNIVIEKAFDAKIREEYINLGPDRDNDDVVPPSSLPQGTIKLAAVPQPDGQPAVTTTVVHPNTAPQLATANAIAPQPVVDPVVKSAVTPQVVATPAPQTAIAPASAAEPAAQPVVNTVVQPVIASQTVTDASTSVAPQPIATAAQPNVNPTPSTQPASVASEIRQIEKDIDTQVNKGVAGTIAGALRDAVPTNILNDNINAAAANNNVAQSTPASMASEIRQIEKDIDTQVNKGVAGTTAGALRDAVPTNILNDNINAAAQHIDPIIVAGAITEEAEHNDA